jgi:hypothetical protein
MRRGKKRLSVRLATCSINDSCKTKTLSIIRDFLPSTESLASENASRLAAMQRAEKNIDELLEDLNGTFHRLRQSGIDEELFDVVAGFEALADAPGTEDYRRAENLR